MANHTTIEIQFWKHIAKKSDEFCWEWIGSKNERGYGQMNRLGKIYKAHRISWEIHYGNIPKGLCVLHHCDNPSCVNPKHLFIGTQKDNVIDMVSKGRARNKIMLGEDNPASKMTENEIKYLRLDAENGMSFRALAKKYKLNKKTVAGIVRRETWRHI